eukprot:4178165-Ditylum_brightwellii.AAC.1
MYFLAKVHKEKLSFRPIVSYRGSLLHGLGVWVDDKLHHIAKDMPTYVRDLRCLKETIGNLILPQGAKLFTADARS